MEQPVSKYIQPIVGQLATIINQSINQFIEQKDQLATYIDMHELRVTV